MQQLLYISSLHPEAAKTIDPAAILGVSRRNNARVNVTGLLFFDGKRFLQVLEGHEDVVDETFRRIQQDPRHRALVVLSRRAIEEREFGQWAMAYRVAGDAGAGDLIRTLVARADPGVRATFEGFANVRRAA